MAQFFFLRIEVADGITLFYRSSVGDCAGRSEQRFGKGSLAGGAVADECYSTKVDRVVLTHVFPQLSRTCSSQGENPATPLVELPITQDPTLRFHSTPYDWIAKCPVLQREERVPFSRGLALR